jgi:hypothetical protein
MSSHLLDLPTFIVLYEKDEFVNAEGELSLEADGSLANETL